MNPAPAILTWLFRSLVLAVCLIRLPDCHAHVVSQLYSEWHPSASGWTLEVQFEAGFAVPAIRDDPDAPAPDRAWLLARGESGWADLRDEATRYLRESLSLRSGNETVRWRIAFPDFDTSPPDFPKLLTDGAYMRMVLTPEAPAGSPLTLLWTEGKVRPDLVMKVASTESGYLTFGPGQTRELPFPGAPAEPVRGSLATSFRQGFLHVVPEGLDHILFVLGLFFYRRKWRPLIHQSLAFTAAHTVTLGLAASGIVRVGGHWVEPIIALSLAVVAIENLLPRRRDHELLRLAVVFGFGLIHGLGFAGALSTWLQPGDGFLPALLSANLGVEAAQAALLGAAWITTTGWHHTHAFRHFRTLSCLAIALTGAWWTVTRITG